MMRERLKILVVDDDPGVLDLISSYLSEHGHRVESRNNGREALDALRDHDFALVISDGKMAEMDGFEFVGIARANYAHLGIVLVTAHEDEFPLSEALRAGADGYITKPFSLKKIALIFNEDYWRAIGRHDWWDAHGHAAQEDQAQF
jgi:CheY-like chemotaxis protein